MEFRVYLKKLQDLEHDRNGGLSKHSDVSSNANMLQSNSRRSSLTYNEKIPIVSGAIGSDGRRKSQSFDFQGSKIVAQDDRLPGRGQNNSYWTTAEGFFASNEAIRRRRRSSYIFLINRSDSEVSTSSSTTRRTMVVQLNNHALSFHPTDVQKNPDAQDNSDENSNPFTENSVKTSDPEYGAADEWMQQEPSGPIPPNGYASNHNCMVSRPNSHQWTEGAMRRKFNADRKKRTEAESHRNRILAGTLPLPAILLPANPA
jgi:hypothetical protein